MSNKATKPQYLHKNLAVLKTDIIVWYILVHWQEFEDV